MSFRSIGTVLLVTLAPLVAHAQSETRTVLFPVGPAYTAGVTGTYVHRIQIRNDNDHAVALTCFSDVCPPVVPAHASVAWVVDTPHPAVPAALAASADDLQNITFTSRLSTPGSIDAPVPQLPVLRTEPAGTQHIDNITLIDDPLHHYNLRIATFAQASESAPEVIVRVYRGSQSTPAYEERVTLRFETDGRHHPGYAEIGGLEARIPHGNGDVIRFEVEPVRPGAEVAALLTVTNIETLAESIFTPQ